MSGGLNRFVTWYEAAPHHVGKGRLTGWMWERLRATGRPVDVRMANGLLVTVLAEETLMEHGVGATCFRTREWEPHVAAAIEARLAPGGMGLDIGANIGVFSALMARCVGPRGAVHAFEPVPATFAQLQATQRANRALNLHCHNLALSDVAGRVEMHHTRWSGNASLYPRPSDGSCARTAVEATTLDSWRSARTVPTISLIKLDVEGAELSVLRGATGVLAADRPALIVEYNAERASTAGWGLADLWCLLASVGLTEPSIIGPGGRVERAELSAIQVPDGAYVDLLFEARR
ncbi:MAG: FkbM family methyltransferase [Fimbriimonadaceae bacterium]